jgi:hypothetical protein
MEAEYEPGRTPNARSVYVEGEYHGQGYEMAAEAVAELRELIDEKPTRRSWPDPANMKLQTLLEAVDTGLKLLDACPNATDTTDLLLEHFAGDGQLSSLTLTVWKTLQSGSTGPGRS